MVRVPSTPLWAGVKLWHWSFFGIWSDWLGDIILHAEMGMIKRTVKTAILTLWVPLKFYSMGCEDVGFARGMVSTVQEQMQPEEGDWGITNENK